MNKNKLDINAYKREWYHKVHPLAKYRKFNGRTEGMKHNCVMCGVPISSYRKFCDTCRIIPRCFKCHIKPKVPYHTLCKECKQESLEKNNREAKLRMAKHRTTQEYKDWLEGYEQTPERKLSHALAQQTYLSTPHGKLRSNWLHYRQRHLEVTFEQYSLQIALRKILPIRVATNSS